MSVDVTAEVAGEFTGNIKPCPGCNGKLHKDNDQCEHVICSNCGYEMCWLCGRQLPSGTYAAVLLNHSCDMNKFRNEEVARRIARQQVSARTGMRIMVDDAHGSTLTIDCTPSETISSLQTKLEQRTGIERSAQTLSYAGRPLRPDTTLSANNIRNRATLTLAANVPGGL